MPPRRSNNFRRGERTRSPQRSGQRAPLIPDIFGLTEADYQRPAYYPRTNDGLVRSAGTLRPDLRDHLSLVADEVEVHRDGRVEIEIDKTGRIARDSERTPADELDSREILASQTLRLDKRADGIELEGEIPLDWASTLIIGDRAVAFRRPEHMVGGAKGESGAVGPAQELPGVGTLSEAVDEHFIMAKRGGEPVIVAVQTSESEARQTSRVYAAKERVLQGLRAEMRQLMSNPRGNRERMSELNKKIREYEKHRKIVFLKQKPLPKEIDAGLQPIKTEINGDSDTIRGLVHLDRGTKTMTVARPIRIDPTESNIDLASINIVDATGLNREVRFVEGDERTLSPLMRRMVSGLHRPRLIQEEDKKIVPFAPLDWQLYRKPSAVPQYRS